jgi:hypothetical protein
VEEEPSEGEEAVLLVGSFEIEGGGAGLYRITAESLRRGGILPSALDPARLSVRVGGEEVAALVVAEGERFGDGDSVLFYVPERDGALECELAVCSGARRMGWAYAEPRGEGEVWTGVVRTDGVLPFRVTAEWQRYLLVGFDRGDALVLDVSDPRNPRILFDYTIIDIPGQSGIYLSLDVEESADCIAIQPEAIRDVSTINAAK